MEKINTHNFMIDFRRIDDKTGLSSYLEMIFKSILKDNNKYFLLINEKNKETIFKLMKGYEGKFQLIFANSTPFSIMQNFEIPYIIFKYKINIFHAIHFDIPLGIIVNSNCKLISTIHDIIPVKYSSYYNQNLLKKFYFRLMYFLCTVFSNRILTVSGYSKNDIVTFFRTKPEKITVIYNCYEIENTKTMRQNNKNKTLFFIGTNFMHKNIHVVIEAVKLLKDRGINVIFNIAGAERDYTNYCRTLVKNLDLGNNVNILGKISDEKLTALYKNSDYFVFPSLVEGFGLPLIEAMCYGLPVISSNKTVMPEIVGDAGILIEPNAENFANSIETLINNPELEKVLINKGFERVKDFSFNKFSKKLTEFYSKL